MYLLYLLVRGKYFPCPPCSSQQVPDPEFWQCGQPGPQLVVRRLVLLDITSDRQHREVNVRCLSICVLLLRYIS